MHSITNDPNQSVTKVTDHLARARQRLSAAALGADRNPEEIHLLAVSKGQSVAKIRAAYEAGQRSFGENYLQEAEKKIDAIRENDIEWHFIGRLQSNKARKVAQRFAWMHTLDSTKLSRRLDAHRPNYAPPLNVCIQVNLAREPQKGGVTSTAVPQLAAEIAALPGLALRGLMAVPPAAFDPQQTAGYFRQLAELQRNLIDEGYALDTLSMGMSADLEIAIAAGSTLVRVGTAVFGPRAN